MIKPRPCNQSRLWPALLRRAMIPVLSTGILCASAKAGNLFPAWRNIYDLETEERSQYAHDTAVDARGNVAVGGYIFDANNRATLYVAKYDGLTGALVWDFAFNAPNGGSAHATGVAFDSGGNVIATGYYDTANGHDYITLKLASDDGAPLWAPVNGLKARTYNGTASGADEALKVIVDKEDSVIVTGRSVRTGTAYDIYTIKYDSAGVLKWEKPYNYFVGGSGNRDDIPSAIAIDSNNNVFVSGLANRNGTDSFYVGRYDAANGNQSWVQTDQNGGYGATGLAVDTAGNVIVCGPARGSGTDYDIKTIKYNGTSGVPMWAESPIISTETPENRWCGIAVNNVGEVSVIGTSATDSTGKRIVTAKYDSNGAQKWLKYSSAPAKFDNDIARGVIVDGSSNTIVIGESEPAKSVDPGLVIARYAPDGTPLPEIHFDDIQAKFSEVRDSISYPPAIAFNNLGGAAIVGNYIKPKDSSPFFVGFSALKLNRFIVRTGETISDVPNLPNAKILALGSPAVSDVGTVAARVTLGAGKARRTAILTQGVTGAPLLPAVQAGSAPDTGGEFKLFLDPVISQTGEIAFFARLNKVKLTESSGVWTTAFDGTVRNALQQGKPVPGNGNGSLIVKSISNISLRGNELISLITVTGEDVNKTNNVVLLGQNTSASNAKILLRTGAPFTVVNGEEETLIKAISILSPAKGSTGHGRWQANNHVTAKLALGDGRTVIVRVDNSGAVSSLFYTGQSAAGVDVEQKWKTFGLPATEVVSIFNQSVVVGNLQTNTTVKADADSVLVSSGFLGTTKIVRENETAGGVDDGAKYAGFTDPVINSNGVVAFQATLKGGKVNASNRVGVFTNLGGSVSLLARQGKSAPNAFPVSGKPAPVWKGFISVVLPGGANAGPLVLGRVGGFGATVRNNLRLFGVDSSGFFRELLRTGQVLDGKIVTNIALLQALPGTAGATRSFNNQGSVGVLVSLKGGGQAIYPLGIP